VRLFKELEARNRDLTESLTLFESYVKG